MKKLITLTATLFLILSTFNIKVYASSAAPQVSADGAVLMDATTGQILYSKNMDAAYPPASTTKVMTALLTLENCKLDQVVTVGKNPPYVIGNSSRIGLVPDEKVTVKDLLYGLILQSGNDCAETLAETMGGTSAKFAEMMNIRAKELGCTDTNFVNPSGLYDKNHKTSARDLALITQALMKHPEFSQVSTTSQYNMPATNKKPARVIWNENKMIQKYSVHYYKGIEGSKTGYTTESLYSFMATASRNGQRLIVTLIHSKQSTFYEDATALLDYGFNNYELVKMFDKGGKVQDYTISSNQKIPLLASEDYYYVRKKGSKDVPVLALSKVNLKNKSFRKYDELMTADFTMNSTPLPGLKLESGSDHIIKNIAAKSKQDSKNSVLTIILGAGAVIAISAAAFMFAKITLRKKRLRKMRRKYSQYYFK